ncbi:MAG: TerB family tellurite resistance protein [Pseudomonadota bacterium]
MAQEPPLSESAAYAIAAWSRFEDEIDDRLLKALVGTFALVAASDGNLAAEESRRFFAMLRTRARLFPRLDLDSVEDGFTDACSALLSDPQAGRERCLGYIEAIRHTASHCQLVLAAAHIAAEADAEEQPEERAIVAEIRALLGVTE